MTGNISFSNNGPGLDWGNKSQIYDDANLHICTNTNMFLYTPMSCVVTTPNTSVSGSH